MGTVALIALVGLLGVIALIGFFVVMSVDRIVENEDTYRDPDTSTRPVHRRNLELKQHLLELVNEARGQAGSPPVRLGANDAAQLYAEQAVEECALANWDRYGLKPHMPYSLMGGYNAETQAITGIQSCDEIYPWYTGEPSRTMREAIAEAIEWTPLNADRALTEVDPQYSTVNLGIAWDRRSLAVVQQFETDRFTPAEEPALRDGVLEIAGSTKALPEFDSDNLLGLLVTFDPPPEPLGLNRLARTACYTWGTPILGAVPRSSDFSADYRTNFTVTQEECPDPYRMDPNLPWPTSSQEIDRLEQAAASRPKDGVEYTFDAVVTADLEAEGAELKISADISEYLEELGPGVYTAFLFLRENRAERAYFFQQSFFYEVDPPEYYGAR